MKEQILNWITKNIGVIIIVMIVVIIIAPSFFTGSTFNWLENCFLFRNVKFTETGNIGDTIGGITAPFIGILSIVLLYITFREQREFNKTQRSANDWTVLLEMKNTIENHSKKVKFELVYANYINPEKQFIGLENIASLDTWSNDSGEIKLDDFQKLYDEIILISDLCILSLEINDKSSLSEEIKKSFTNTITHYSNKASLFFVLCLEDRVSVLSTMDDIEGTPVKDKEKVTKEYIKKFGKYIKNSF